MVRTPSTMTDLGSPAPHFRLPNVAGGEVSLEDFSENSALLVMFISKHCPFVKHVAEGLAELGRDYQNRDLAIVAISSNDIENYPDDAPPQLAQMAREQGFVFPVCFDESQEVAKKFRAACTPDFFLYDKNRKLAYRGQLDSSRPGNEVPVTGEDLRQAIDALLEGRSVAADQRASLGCNIKWKAGNEPDYF